MVLGFGQVESQRVTGCPVSGHRGGVRWRPETAVAADVSGHGLPWVLVRYGVEGSGVNGLGSCGRDLPCRGVDGVRAWAHFPR